MGRRKIARNEGQEEYAFRRLLGAVLVEAVLDALSEKGVRWQDRTSALDFLHDENIQALCEAHLVLPPGLWRAFAEAVDQGVEIDYAVVEGLIGRSKSEFLIGMAGSRFFSFTQEACPLNRR